jgi:hypothetical protein
VGKRLVASHGPMGHAIDPQLAAYLNAKFEEFARMVSSAFQRLEDHINARFDRLERRLAALEESNA